MIYFKSVHDILIASKDREIAFLVAQNERLQAERDFEKKRADTAIDRLLSEKQIPSVQPFIPAKPDPEKEKIVEQLDIVASIGMDFDSEKEEKREVA